MIWFYSNNNDSWSQVDIGDDPFCYDKKGGFPALKHFVKEKTHFLLIAGGMDTQFKLSSQVILIQFSLSSADTVNSVKVFRQNNMGEGDFFPGNQWVSRFEDQTNQQGSGSYMIVGAKGTYMFEVDLDNKNEGMRVQV